ncbi:type I-E CRISPR-associated protein Cse2/CasB [Streptomyces sp. NPDC026673]|uniref:type I-E CRISPR-associated protein Cse2/CasB n=1 Tax=Streptomyces sp. NPDC026673 TaxID=3155724 RepID=UPI0033FA5C97
MAGQEIGRLQRDYLDDRPGAVATLARLRRTAGMDATRVPDLWGLIDLEPLYADPALRHDEACAAVYTALALWSLHQHSRRTGMHRSGGDELGAAVRRLMSRTEVDDPVRKRFIRAGAASSLPALAARLREITLLLRSRGLPLDYSRLSDQLYHWQQPEGPDRIRRSWGRSFHTGCHSTPTQTDWAATMTDPKDAS